MAVKNLLTWTVAAALLAAGCTTRGASPAAEEAPVAAELHTVVLSDVATYAEAGGIVRARATAHVASRILAPIVAVHVRAGDAVRRGATLVTLDARAVEAERARATAAVAAAGEAVRAAAADIQGAEAALVLARATHERMRDLHARRSATPQELDQAVAGLRGAEAEHGAAQARLAAASAAKGAADAAARAADVGASYATLAAPFDGFVAERHADPGSIAAPGTPLLVLEDTTGWRLDVRLDEARAAHVRPGAAVNVRLDSSADGGTWTAGRVAEIARVDPQSHTFLVRIDLPSSPALRSGLFGRARFEGPARRTLAIPPGALVERGQLTFVYMIDGEGRARLRPVSRGPAHGTATEVLAGLREGDVIVARPEPVLRDGARVMGARR
jgi:RND family efflux transporter MFP subunit